MTTKLEETCKWVNLCLNWAKRGVTAEQLIAAVKQAAPAGMDEAYRDWVFKVVDEFAQTAVDLVADLGDATPTAEEILKS